MNLKKNKVPKTAKEIGKGSASLKSLGTIGVDEKSKGIESNGWK